MISSREDDSCRNGLLLTRNVRRAVWGSILMLGFLLAPLQANPYLTPLGLEGRWVGALEQAGGYLYAGTDQGVYRKDLTRAEDPWTTLGPAQVSVGAILVTSQTIYAGQGLRPPEFNLPPEKSRSLYRLRQGASQWEVADSGISTSSVVVAIQRAGSGGTLIAATWGVVYRSFNDGDSWTSTGFPFVRIGGMAVSSSDPQTIYVGGDKNIDAALLQKSEDGGATWSDLSANVTASGILGLLGDPLDKNTLYLLEYGLGRSTDGGASFVWRSTGGSTSVGAVSPVDPRRLYTAFRGYEQYFFLSRSLDRGDTWTTLEESTERPGILCICPDASEADVAYLGTKDGALRLQAPEVLPPTPTPTPSPTPTATPTASPQANSQCGGAWNHFE